ncbi:MAG: tetratricopeptide repeat protein [Thiobacillus sp.]|nr:tetratricopeptide repeat protein [Thiobacillus sp.]
MHQYGVRRVEKLLSLPRSAIRGMIKAGFVSPVRGPRGAFLFSFQDLIVLRTAWALAQADLPQRRIIRSLKHLRDQLPESVPLSGLRIGAVGDRVVVQQGDTRWQADSGQYLLALEVDLADGILNVIDRKAQAKARAEDWFDQAVTLEETDVATAQRAYEEALAADPAHAGAATNLGRLLHESGRPDAAERVYRAGLAACGSDALLHYNLGVLLEDTGRTDEAVHAYEHALADDAGLADCHYNLARLHQAQGRQKEAIRHLARYRKLTGEDRGG